MIKKYVIIKPSEITIYPTNTSNSIIEYNISNWKYITFQKVKYPLKCSFDNFDSWFYIIEGTSIENPGFSKIYIKPREFFIPDISNMSISLNQPFELILSNFKFFTEEKYITIFFNYTKTLDPNITYNKTYFILEEINYFEIKNIYTSNVINITIWIGLTDFIDENIEEQDTFLYDVKDIRIYNTSIILSSIAIKTTSISKKYCTFKFLNKTTSSQTIIFNAGILVK
jgi:hypothetical protein